MSMGMSFSLAKPSTSIKLHGISSDSNIQYLASRSPSSLLFHPLPGFHYYLSSSLRQSPRRPSVTVRSSIQQDQPSTPPHISSDQASSPGFAGKGWIAGIVLSLLLPFLKNKWGPLLFLKKEIDQRLQTVEDVAETLEKVADRVDDMAEDFGKNLPEGSFKTAVNMIEDVAEKVEAAAHFTDEAIDKVQKWEDEMESSFHESKQRESSELNEEKIDSKPT